MELPPFTMENLRQHPDELVVFMCRRCRLPLGDSTNFFCEIQETQQDLLMHAVSRNVIIQGEKILNNYQDKNGSVFQILQCKGCEARVGKFFVTTAREQDNRLQKFLLHATAITNAKYC